MRSVLADGARWIPSLLQLCGGQRLYVRATRRMWWWAYAPLTSRVSQPHSDYWTLPVGFGFGSIGTRSTLLPPFLHAVSGMTLDRMLCCMAIPIMSGWFSAISPLTAANHAFSVVISADISLTPSGGSATLWMHFFWIFCHPEVYVSLFPLSRLHPRSFRCFRNRSLGTRSW